MKLLLLFLFFISTVHSQTTYAEQEWKDATGCSIDIGQSNQNYTLSEDCNLYNPGGMQYNDISINNIVSIRGTRNNELTTIDKNTDLVTITAISGNRHFFVDGANAKLTLRYIKLVGGDVSSNTGGSGGSIYIAPGGGELSLYSSIVFNNKAVYGGGIYPNGGSSMNKNVIMNIYNSIIHINTAQDGGGIFINNAVGTIENTMIDNNQADTYEGAGGGIRISGSNVTMKYTIISNNKAESGAGLALRYNSTKVTLRQISFIDNNAYFGSAIYTFASPTISLINTNLKYDDDGAIGLSHQKYGKPIWKTCSDNLCTEPPFTGTCRDIYIATSERAAASNKEAMLSVVCPSSSCNSNELSYLILGVNASSHCEPSIGEWNCAARTNEGNFTRSTNCKISGSNHIFVSNTLEITGTNNTDMNNLITITAATKHRHFYLNHPNATLTLRYIKLVGGDLHTNNEISVKFYGGSIFIWKQGKLNLYSSIVSNNKAVTGGGIFVSGNKGERILGYGYKPLWSSTNMNLNNCIIEGNEVTSNGRIAGGGIFMEFTVGVIKDTTIHNNKVGFNFGFFGFSNIVPRVGGDGEGGGMFIDTSKVTMENTTISNNIAGEFGGGIQVKGENMTNITLRQCNFFNNYARQYGDSLYIHESPTMSLINTPLEKFFDNVIEKPGNARFDSGYVYRYGTYDDFPIWKTCSDNLCTQEPFTGTCSAVDETNPKYGVICLPEWNFEPSGTFSKSEDCSLVDGSIMVYETLEIRGTRHNNLTTIDKNTDLVTVFAASNQRHFFVVENGRLTLRHIKLTGGDVTMWTSPPWKFYQGRGGSIYIDSNKCKNAPCELNLYSSIVTNNKAIDSTIYAGGKLPDFAGYIRSEARSDIIITIHNSIIHNNTASETAEYETSAGITTINIVGTIENTTIDNNWGNALHFKYSNLNITNTIISNNRAHSNGGGVILAGWGIYTFRQTSIINNTAPNGYGDGLYIFESPTTSMINTHFDNPPNNDNIFVREKILSYNYDATWRTCETVGNLPCNVGETCTSDTNFPTKAVLCQRIRNCSASVLTGCKVGDKEAIIAAYKELNQCSST